MPQLDPSFFASQLFWLAICFGILYGATAYGIAPRMQSLLERREKLIHTMVSETEAAHSKADNLKNDFERLLETARHRAHDFIVQAVYKVTAETTQAKKTSAESFQKKIKEAEQRLEGRKSGFLVEMDKAADELAKTMVDKILGRANGAPSLSSQSRVSRSRAKKQ